MTCSNLRRLAVPLVWATTVLLLAGGAIDPSPAGTATYGSVRSGRMGTDGRLHATAWTAFARYWVVAGGVTSIRAKIVVPTVTCTTADRSSMFAFVGIYGVANNAFVESAAVVKAACNETKLVYTGFIISDSVQNGASLFPLPGGVIVVMVSVTTDSDSFAVADKRTAERVSHLGTKFVPAGAQFTVQRGAMAHPLFRLSLRSASVHSL